jgi:chloramphenicol-sensitive protein RarD
MTRKVGPDHGAWGILYGAGAYSLWGLFPIYFKQTARVPALEVLAHRIVWALLALALVALATRGRSMALRVPARVHALYALAAALVGVNWFVYVWAVSSNFVVETSLGYFITPLVNVALGVAVFRERLRPAQWLAIGLATVGVVYLTLTHGSLPWISLALALSFGSYGLVKKQAPLGSVQGLTLETGVLFMPALAYLILLGTSDSGSFLHAGTRIDLLLAASGPVTIGPLLMFSKAVRLVPLSIIGMLQYIAPSIQFLLGVLVYREPFSSTRLVGFILVWVALVVFSVDSAVRLKPDTTITTPDDHDA